MASHGPEPPPAKKAKENSWDKNGDTFLKGRKKVRVDWVHDL